MALPSFVIPPAGNIARQRKLADVLAQAGTNAEPVQSWTQGAARLAQALAGAYGNYQANQMEGQRQSALAQALSGDISTQDLERAAVASGDADLLDILKQRRAEEMARSAARAGLQPIWGTENGRWTAYQPSNIPGQAPQRMQFPPNFQYQPPVQGYDTGTEFQLRTKAGGRPPPGDGAPMPPAGTPHPLANPQAAPAAPAEVPPPAGPPSNVIPKDIVGKARDEKLGELGGKASFDLPGIETTAQNTLDAIERVRNHPGREYGTGPLAGRVPAAMGDQAGFVNEFDTLKAKTFLEAYNQLRGAGAITEREGQAGTEAISALSRITDPVEFDKQLDILKGVVERGVANARLRAGGPAAAPPPGGGGISYTYDAQGNLVQQ